MKYPANFGMQTACACPRQPARAPPNILTRRADTHLSCNGDEKEKRRGFADAPPAARAIISYHTHIRACEASAPLSSYHPHNRGKGLWSGPPLHTRPRRLQNLFLNSLYLGFYALLNQIMVLLFAAFGPHLFHLFSCKYAGKGKKKNKSILILLHV